jgi:LacI family transcriptional regulator
MFVFVITLYYICSIVEFEMVKVKVKVKVKGNITIRDVAREAGVSPALVSFVMINQGLGKRVYRVNELTEKRVLDVASKLNYHPNLSAKALKNGKTNTIGVILSDISNPFFAEIARYIEDEAYKYNYSVIFGSTDEDPVKFRNIVKVMQEKGVDGLIVVPCEKTKVVISDMARNRFPVVLIDRTLEGVDIPSIVLDNKMASKSINDILIEKGYHHIEMLSYSLSISNIMDRENGYLESMDSAGLSDFSHIHRIGHHEQKDVIDEIINNARIRGVEAFLFATNSLAIQGMSTMFRKGFHVPQDFGIACFDYNSAFDIYDTDLVYARQPVEQFAKESILCILEQIRANAYKIEYDRSKMVILQPTIIRTGN